MPYFWGVLTGIVLTILVVFIIDNVGDEPGTQDVVNWEYVGVQLGASAKKVGEEMRKEVHEATAPQPGDDETPPEVTPPDTTPAQ